MGHLHFLHLMSGHGHGGAKDIPKGCLAIKVGREGSEQHRFVVPILHLSHPLFLQLLKEAEDEYGFEHKGTITLPCDVEQFRNIQVVIDRDYSCRGHGHRYGHAHHGHTLLTGCFKA